MRTNHAPYSVTLSVTGGQPPYTWLLAQLARLADRVECLSSSAGVISGTPANNTPGTYDFTVQMTDSSFPTPDSVQMNYSITVH